MCLASPAERSQSRVPSAELQARTLLHVHSLSEFCAVKAVNHTQGRQVEYCLWRAACDHHIPDHESAC